jgi:hypothetical protein
MISKLSGIAFTAALAAACYALAVGYGPPAYYDAEGAAPVAGTQAIATDPPPAPDDASVAKDKQNSPLLQAQD